MADRKYFDELLGGAVPGKAGRKLLHVAPLPRRRRILGAVVDVEAVDAKRTYVEAMGKLIDGDVRTNGGENVSRPEA